MPRNASTRDLIAACPSWCNEQHEPNAHPEDVIHTRPIGVTPFGAVAVHHWPVKVTGSPQFVLAVEGLDKDLSREAAIDTANALLEAVRVLDEVSAS